MSLLEITDLKTQIRLRTSTVQAVDGVSLSVEAGETLGIVGESGSGKTMTGMSVMRLLPPGGFIAGGSIVMDGVDLAHADLDTIRNIRGNDIGMVFQDPMTSLNPTMTIGRQIAEPVRLHKKVSKKAAMDRAAEVLALVGMPRPAERLNDYPHQLSGGLRQRAMIAMALACAPKLLIADEPTTALDVTIQAQILSLLDDLKAQFGMAMILITHDMGVIAGRADRVAVMYAGRIVETASTVELFDGVRHPYTEALLASIPQLDQDKTQKLYSIPGIPPDLTAPPPGCRFAPRCAYADDICRTDDPVLGGPDPLHSFACHHPRSTSAEELAGAGDRISDVLLARRADGELPHGTGEFALSAIGLGEPVSRAEDQMDGDALVSAGVEGGGGPDLIVFDNVSKEFPVTAGAILQRRIGTNKAVSDVSLSIRRGETFGLVGESGCGKTTLGRMLVALETPTAGEITFDGQSMAHLAGHQLRNTRRNLQMMFQDPYASLDPRMQVRSIIAEPLKIEGKLKNDALRARVDELLSEVGLSPSAASRYPHEFSGGQRQRIGLARALALNPEVIVADEPVSALDVSIRSQILNLMKRLQLTHHITYLVISHDLSVVRYLSDRIGVMYLGRLVEVGTGDDIYSHPAHPYTRGLLDTIPVPKPQLERTKKGSPIKGELPSVLHPPSGCRFRTRCPRAQDLCAAEVPPLRSFGGEHLAACHFPLEEAVEGEVGAAAVAY